MAFIRSSKENKMKKIYRLGTAAAMAVSFMGIVAHANTKDMDAKFKKMDTDSDGKISAAEFKAEKDEKFEEMDTDKDGFVSMAESQAHYAHHGHHAGKKKMKK